MAASPEAELREVVAALSRTPAWGSVPKMARLMERRLEELEAGLSWPLAEAMAFAFALRAGVPVRLCGQDVERGAFSQRHLAAVHPLTGRRSHPMDEHGRHGAAFEVVNSPLSEYAVLGFEYGYALGSKVRCASGRRSSATSLMAPRSSSTSSWPQALRSGARPPTSSC